MKSDEGNAVEEIKKKVRKAFGAVVSDILHEPTRRDYFYRAISMAVQETAEKIRDEIESLEFTDLLSKELIKYDDKGYVLDRLSINTMVCDAIENSKIFSKYGVKDDIKTEIIKILSSWFWNFEKIEKVNYGVK